MQHATLKKDIKGILLLDNATVKENEKRGKKVKENREGIEKKTVGGCVGLWLCPVKQSKVNPGAEIMQRTQYSCAPLAVYWLSNY